MTTASTAQKESDATGRGGVGALGVRLPCPQCGALVTPPHQVETFTCPWCGSSLNAGRGPRVFHLAERPRLSREGAEQALRRWFAGPDTPRGLEDGATVEVGELSWFPFLRVRGSGAERVVPLGPLGLPDLLDLPRMPADMVAAEPASAAGSTAVVDPDAVREGVRAASTDPSVREVAIEERAYYPVAYRYGGQPYTAVVSAGAGAVLAGRRPARVEVVGERSVAVGVMGVLLAEAVLLPGLPLKVAMVAVTAGGMYPLLRWLVATRL